MIPAQRHVLRVVARHDIHQMTPETMRFHHLLVGEPILQPPRGRSAQTTWPVAGLPRIPARLARWSMVRRP